MDSTYPIEIPPLVESAKTLATQLGFDLRAEGNLAGAPRSGPSACVDEVGSLLRVLASGLPGGLIGEVGTGAGVGTAWLSEGLRSDANLISVETEPRLAGAATELFAERTDVSVIAGGWRDVMPRYGPFDLLFFDGDVREALRTENWTDVAALVKHGGFMLLDDVTPEELWPESWRGSPDPKRELAFRSGLFVATELRVKPEASVLLLVRDAVNTG